MAEPNASTAPGERPRDRLVAGVLVAGCLSAGFGLATRDFWDLIQLSTLPLRPSYQPFVPPILIAVMIGALAAWPRSHWIGILLGTIGLGLLTGLGFSFALGAATIGDYATVGLGLLPLACPTGLILGGCIRGGIFLTRWVGIRWPQYAQAMFLWVALACLVLGVALSFAFDSAEEMLAGRRRAVRAVDQYAQSQGWEGYELGPADNTSEGVRVILTLQGGAELLCWSRLTVRGPNGPIPSVSCTAR